MREEMERRRREGGDETGPSPFDLMPFGGMLEQMLGGAGGWGRTYTYDPETGQWVEVTGEEASAGEPEPEPKESAAGSAPANGRRARRQRSRRSGATMMSPFGMLGGMGMPSDGSGEFEVEPPEELTTFADVGGMEKLKQEVRDTVGSDARAPRRRRALRDRLERDPAARPARRRQDVLRPRDRRRVRHEPDARLDRRPGRLAGRRLGAEHREGLRDGARRTCRASCSSTSSTPSPSAATTRPTRSRGAPSTSCSPRSRRTATSASCS